jgi:lipase chaperone LimK
MGRVPLVCMRRVVLLALAALVVAGAFLGRARSISTGHVAISGDGGVVPAPAIDMQDARSVTSFAGDDVPRRPRSLRGTRVDGGLATDADGHFVPTLDARRLFDYFLTATGEAPDDALRARIQSEIARRLAPDAAREAVALLDRYLLYRARVRTLATSDVPEDSDLDARLATLVAVRREVLGADAAEAFFAEEEADARRLLEARRITNDTSLTPEERTARIEAVFAEAEAALPADVREARAATRLATTLRGAEAEIRARGGDDAEVAALRERLAGPEAAKRLADLDRERGVWQGRVAAFRTERDRLANDPQLAPDTRTAAIARLLDESFTPAERRRVEALDRIAADAAPAAP